MENKNTTAFCTSIDPDFRQLVYDLMNGNIDLENAPWTEAQYVEDEFDDGKRCARLYEESCLLRQHLFERLGSLDDIEVERLMDSLLEIGRCLCFKMFDYGWGFAMRKNDISYE